MTAEPEPFLVLNDFLAPEERESLIRFVRGQGEFAPAQVTRPGESHGAANDSIRRAAVATSVDEMFGLFEDKLRAVLPHARRETSVGYFALGKLERQITAHGDGDFFSAHNDLGDPWSESASRRLSYVYYFHEHPREFKGGELRLFDRGGDTFQVVEPVDNSIVFFPSTALHEVCPIRVPGDPTSPGATRFTMNGWFHDRDHVRAEPALDPETRTKLTQRYTPSFTDVGFKKVATPPALHHALRAVYDQRLEAGTPEQIDETYLPTGNPDFLFIDDVKAEYHQALQSIHEEWAGVELEPTAAYGLRVYRNGQTLIPHTDVLMTHVISSIVHIAHDTNEPWPLWIVDLQGNEHNVVLEEGEMLLYESARCPHARPTPLDGSAYCSLFLHYKPVDWNVSYSTLVEQARADGATDVLPPHLWPADSEPA